MAIYQMKIKPMGAVRMTRRGKFTSSTAQRYLQYKSFIGYEFKKQRKGDPLKGPIEVEIIFTMPIPESWSLKKKREALGGYHTKKSDIDNLIKGCFDAANKIVWEDDNQVCKVSAIKIYGNIPGIRMTVLSIGVD